MKKFILAAALSCVAWVPAFDAAQARHAPAAGNLSAWEKQAQNVTIIRDDWGIPHVYGKTDADAVFGVIYAQAEDDFNRIETNYLNAMGRLAEAEGESAIYRDLRMKLFIDPADLQKQYERAPAWLKSLMNAWADGLNFFLSKHPEVKPRVITRFEPWMALSFSEGSIGGDIEQVNLKHLEAFYGKGRGSSAFASAFAALPLRRDEPPVLTEPGGSNGIALGPSVTQSGRAMLLINPHTSFFFRAEAQMVSEEGLNAYGALTWGQFFIYQGFNDKAGWMHTSSSVDNIDEYLETIVEQDGKRFYKVGPANSDQRPIVEKQIVIPFKAGDGSMKDVRVTAYYTHRGPIVRQIDGKWVSVRLMNSPLDALTQSYSRTKARNIDEYKRVMAMHTNSSNNTLYADAGGNYAYFHSNFVPRRDPSFDWGRPVDGSNPATEWKGLHTFAESPNVINPPNGWVYNTNNYPYSAAGPGNSPRQDAFPSYMDAGSENARGVHAIMVLTNKKGFTLQKLIDAAYDSYLPAFDTLLPPLFRDFDASPAGAAKQKLAEPVATLRAWDKRWSIPSVATALAVFYGDEILARVADSATAARTTAADYAATRATPEQRLNALSAAIDSLTSNFGSWKTPWGDINRFQRISPAIVHPFDDAKPSIPVPFTSARFGSLASFGAAPRNGTKKWYGTSGNSFVAVVEFGDRVKARAVSAGGQSGNPASPHFNDQAKRYSTGDLREVYFYRDQLKGHTERTYHPGK
jgi:acyl-homoserine-lactone acylase